MFELGFSEIIVIMLVALVVIGPDKLPQLARTYGRLYGRLQRYFSGIRQDIDRQVALETMRKATADAQQKMLTLQSTLVEVHHEIADLRLADGKERSEGLPVNATVRPIEADAMMVRE